MDKSTSDPLLPVTGLVSSLRTSCPTCGAPVQANQRFCDQCGAPLDRPSNLEASYEEMGTISIAREERRWASVLFADVSGFTSMSERMDPEDVKALANQIAERLSQEVRRYGGMVINIAGDEVMAVFGAPVAHEDDAERAVRAGLAIRDCKLSDDPDQAIRVHVGINTGQVMAGLNGPKERRDYTVMGDTTNIAARLLSAAPAGHVYVGAETVRMTQRSIHYLELEPITAKGKSYPVKVWEALDVTDTPHTRPLGTATLIGREEELTGLLNIWKQVAYASQPHLVTILSEPGIGKSRLAAEFERWLPTNVTIWHGRCLPYGEALGYWALAMALREAAGITPDDEAELARAKLGELVAEVIELEEGNSPEVARHLALLSGLDVASDRLANSGDQRILHISVCRFVEAYARQHPLCLMIDDIQWADEALLELIEIVAARVQNAQLLIVTLARPELIEKRATWGRNLRSSTSLQLKALNESAEYELIQELCLKRGIPVEFVSKVSQSTGGNPLFIEEVVAMVAEGGSPADVPSVIKMLIAARLDTLPMKERTAIQFAAIYGKVFWEGGLGALDNRLAVDLAGVLDSLEKKDLLRASARSQLRGDHEYSFKHDLIRDVAYEILPKVERRGLHSRAVDWLEVAAGDHVENYLDQLAHHATQAGQSQRAINFLIRAAQRASRAAAHRQAAALLAQAITLADGLGLPALLADLHARRGKAFVNIAMWAQARPELEAALAELPLENKEQRALVLIDLATIAFWTHDIPSLRRYASDAMTIAEAINRNDIVAGAMGVLTLAYSSEGDIKSVVNWSTQALERAGDTAIGAVTFGVAIRGLNYYWVGQYNEAIASAQLGVEVARKMNDTLFLAYTLPHAGLALAEKGEYAKAEQVFKEAQRFGREYEVWPMLARTISISAGYHLDLFDFAGHAAIAEEARELARSANLMNPLVSANLDLLFNYVRRQEVGQAEKVVSEVSETVAQAAGSHGWLWRLRLAQACAELAFVRGDMDETLSLAEQAIAQSQERGRVKYQSYGLETRARSLAGLGRKKAAIVEAKRAVELIRPIGAPALFFRAAVTLIDLEEDDALLAEARTTAKRIINALTDNEMRNLFEQAEPVRLVLGKNILHQPVPCAE